MAYIPTTVIHTAIVTCRAAATYAVVLLAPAPRSIAPICHWFPLWSSTRCFPPCCLHPPSDTPPLIGYLCPNLPLLTVTRLFLSVLQLCCPSPPPLLTHCIRCPIVRSATAFSVDMSPDIPILFRWLDIGGATHVRLAMANFVVRRLVCCPLTVRPLSGQ